MPNKSATIVLSQVKNEDMPFIQGDIIAVDRGCNLLIKLNKKITQAIGDFDSIDATSLESLQLKGVPIQTFPKIKNQSDAELALQWTINQGYESIRIIGFAGGRLDHYQAILQMLFHFQHSGITLITPLQSIQYLKQGTYQLRQEKKEKYFSIFTLSNASVSIENARYPLTKKQLTVKDTFTLSNEWVQEKTVKLTIHSGEVLLYRSMFA